MFLLAYVRTPALSRAHCIPEMENGQIHRHHQRTDNHPCHNQQHWLQKRGQIICQLKGLLRMMAGKVFQHNVE